MTESYEELAKGCRTGGAAALADAAHDACAGGVHGGEEVVAVEAPVHFCEGDYPSERWAGLRGRTSAAVLQSLAPDLSERVTFTCGPAPYMSEVRSHH